MSRFADNALLGGGVRVGVGIREQRKKIKGTTKPLMAILDISPTIRISTINHARICIRYYKLRVLRLNVQ